MKATNTITIPGNFNNKLACPIMQHIDIAPWAPIPGSLMEKAVVEFKTADNSSPPTYWKLFDIANFGSDKLNDCLTYPSHGMDSCDFYQWLVKQYSGKKDYTKLAVYFYKKIA